MNLTGTKIASKYMVGPKIGSGSFGEVYVVNEVGTYQIYALKKASIFLFLGRWKKQACPTPTVS